MPLGNSQNGLKKMRGKFWEQRTTIESCTSNLEGMIASLEMNCVIR